jgi:hypothetical protein
METELANKDGTELADIFSYWNGTNSSRTEENHILSQ